MISAREALARLREGNRRVVEGTHGGAATLAPEDRLALAQAQRPFAVILGCSDSRVPAELVFGQGFGDLFVIRVAGNIAAPSLIGSAEFAAARLGTRLVLVMGHTGCGAVTAAVEELRHPTPGLSPGLRAIVEPIRPVVEPLLAMPLARDPDALVAHAVRANVRAVTQQLRRESAVLAELARGDGLIVAGAEYDMQTGVVDFFDP